MRQAIPREGAERPRWTTVLHAATVCLTVVILMGLVPACGGDDNGGGTSTTPCLRFEGSGVPGAITVTAVDGEPDDDDCNLLFVDLMVNDVQNLFAANIVASYPESVVSFAAASGTGSVLTSDNTAIEIDAAVTGAGEATIAITRVSQTGIDVPDDGVGQFLIRLVFSLSSSSGSGSLEFTTGELLNPGDPQPPPAEIEGSVWTGGTIGIIQI